MWGQGRNYSQVTTEVSTLSENLAPRPPEHPQKRDDCHSPREFGIDPRGSGPGRVLGWGDGRRRRSPAAGLPRSPAVGPARGAGRHRHRAARRHRRTRGAHAEAGPRPQLRRRDVGVPRRSHRRHRFRPRSSRESRRCRRGGRERGARAAAREAIEESGVEVDPTALRRWSHWTPPPLQDKRFSTAFFVAPAVAADVRVTIDDGEIRAHRWARPDEVIRRRDAGEVALAPPTFITLTQLLRHDSVARILDAAPTGPIEHFSTRVALRDGGWTAVYHGDSTFDELGDLGGKGEVDLDAPGPRHRLVMAERWSYQREGC
ncbi:MAG: NUDIX domain-containing protein [Microthrixaceae bacterium]